jgi:hypothetical protein
VDLDRLRGRRRRLVAPQLVDQAVGAERLVGVEQKQGEHGASLAAAKRNALTLVEGLQGTEDVEIHASWGPDQS